MQQSLFCGFVPFNVGSWCILGSLQNDDLEIDIINRFWNCYTAQAPSGHWVLDDGKHNFENHFDENNQKPYPSLFKHLLSGHFVVKRPIHGPCLVDRVSRPPARHFLEKNVGSTKWLVPPPTHFVAGGCLHPFKRPFFWQLQRAQEKGSIVWQKIVLHTSSCQNPFRNICRQVGYTSNHVVYFPRWRPKRALLCARKFISLIVFAWWQCLFFLLRNYRVFFLDRISLDSCGILGGRPVK